MKHPVKEHKRALQRSDLFAYKKDEASTSLLFKKWVKPERTKQMEQILNFQVPAEGLELVILLHTQY